MKKRLFLSISSAVVLLLVAALSWWAWQSRKAAVPRDQALYEKNCAVCHGVKGDGQGEAAYLLQPTPRNLRAGKFRLVSSKNLQPTREDVFGVIRDGMPGTPMPSWEHLPESDRWVLADYVLKLNWEGWVDVALSQGDTRDAAEAFATEMVQPGDPIPIPPEPPPSPAGLKEGRKHYVTACANCHGVNGEGRRDPTWRTAEGFPSWSRNLRQGVFKGGREGKELYLRFATGLPGTPMPSQSLSPEQVWRVVQYVQSLSDPAAQEQAQIRTKEVVVKRLEQLPTNPDDPGWDKVPEVGIPLMALWWHDRSIGVVRVKAAHDGQQLAFRLEWDDSSRDTGGARQLSFPDGAAVQLTTSSEPPLFAMGARGQPINIWHWKSLWSEDRQQFQDVATAFPNTAVDAYYGREKGWRSGPREDAEFLPAEAVHNLIASSRRPSIVEDANAAGLGTLSSQAAAKQNVQGVSRWEKGVWRLHLVRAMKADDAADARLRPDGRASVAFAVWNGSAGDRNGQKSVSIWNTLILE